MQSFKLTRMFPLSSVLFPGGVMPLHIFEPRYLAMVNEAIDDDRSFGVVLIERGSEVGGGDMRFDIGTRAQIVSAAVVDDDRMALVALGTQRLRVESWLEDAPYPRAMAMELPPAGHSDDLGRSLDDATKAWRRVVALASELGADVGPAELTLPEDPQEALWTLCGVAPLEQIDRQRLLETDDPQERAARLQGDLEDTATVLEARLSGRLG